MGCWWIRSKKSQRSRAETCAAETRAKASPTKLSSSDFSCSVCNRQFRAKIGLISHLRTHKQYHFTYLIRIGYCQLWQTNEVMELDHLFTCTYYNLHFENRNSGKTKTLHRIKPAIKDKWQHQKRTCAHSEDSDKPVQSRSLTRIFTEYIMDSQGCKVSLH